MTRRGGDDRLRGGRRRCRRFGLSGLRARRAARLLAGALGLALALLGLGAIENRVRRRLVGFGLGFKDRVR